MLREVSKLSVLLNILVFVRSEPPSSGYGTPLGAPISSYGTPNYHANDIGGDHHGNGNGNGNGHGHYNEEPKSYEFGYQVKDDYTGTDYNQKESSDGNQVRGEYRVALPDGRTQIVTYWADWQTGYHADVRYEGEAQYPDQYNKNGYNGGYQGGYGSGPSSINNLAHGGQDSYNYDSYNSGYSNKAPPSNAYGAV